MTRDHYKILKDIYLSAGIDVPVITEECAKKMGLEITDKKDNIIVTTSTKKKSRYSKLQKQLKSLENRFDLLDDDMLEIKWEIDDIKHEMSYSAEKCLSKTKHSNRPKSAPESNSSDEDIFI